MNADPRRLAPRSLRPRLCAVETKPELRAGRSRAASLEARLAARPPLRTAWGRRRPAAGGHHSRWPGCGSGQTEAPPGLPPLPLENRAAAPPVLTVPGTSAPGPALAFPDLCDRLPPHFCDHCKQAMRLRFGRLSIKFEVRRPAGGGWAGLHTAPLTRVPARSPLVPRRPGPGRGVSRDAGGGENDRKADGQAPAKVGGPTDTVLTIRGTRRPRSGGTNPAMHKTGRLRPGEGGGSARGAAW